MPIRTYNPTTPSRRKMTVDTYEDITKTTPEKSLLIRRKKNAGRNSYGRITVRHMGGGNRTFVRIVDYRRDKDGIPAKVAAIEYDPNRSARLALLNYKDGEKRYIVCPDGLKVGDEIISSDSADIKIGNTLSIKAIPVGTVVHCVELKKGAGAKLGRTAGSTIIIMAKESEYAHLKLPSGEIRLVDVNCLATIGQVGNLDHENITIGKAGRNRWKGIRPSVRGIAMNPCDHPHGSQVNHAKGGNHPVSYSNVPTKGYKTRSNKSTDRFILKRRK